MDSILKNRFPYHQRKDSHPFPSLTLLFPAAAWLSMWTAQVSTWERGCVVTASSATGFAKAHPAGMWWNCAPPIWRNVQHWCKNSPAIDYQAPRTIQGRAIHKAALRCRRLTWLKLVWQAAE